MSENHQLIPTVTENYLAPFGIRADIMRIQFKDPPEPWEEPVNENLNVNIENNVNEDDSRDSINEEAFQYWYSGFDFIPSVSYNARNIIFLLEVGIDIYWKYMGTTVRKKDNWYNFVCIIHKLKIN